MPSISSSNGRMSSSVHVIAPWTSKHQSISQSVPFGPSTTPLPSKPSSFSWKGSLDPYSSYTIVSSVEQVVPDTTSTATAREAHTTAALAAPAASTAMAHRRRLAIHSRSLAVGSHSRRPREGSWGSRGQARPYRRGEGKTEA